MIKQISPGKSIASEISQDHITNAGAFDNDKVFMLTW